MNTEIHTEGASFRYFKKRLFRTVPTTSGSNMKFEYNFFFFFFLKFINLYVHTFPDFCK